MRFRFVCGCTVRRDRTPSPLLGFLPSLSLCCCKLVRKKDQAGKSQPLKPALGGTRSNMRAFFARYLHLLPYQSLEPEPLSRTAENDSPPTTSTKPPHASKLAQSPRLSFRHRLTRRFRTPRRSHPSRDACVVCTLLWGSPTEQDTSLTKVCPGDGRVSRREIKKVKRRLLDPVRPGSAHPESVYLHPES